LLADSYGRIATDLRVSLTDRCNLRCAYCMPPEGLDWLPTPALLTDDEVVRLARIGVERLGITEIRYTGGEPLLRRGLPGIVARSTALRPRPEISITTNGIGLARVAGALAEAGLYRINVSLDTLRPDVFRTLAKRDRLADVLAGLAAAAGAGLAPVKVNTVLMRGVNSDEAVPLLRFCLERGYQLRFIEQMPLDAQHGWRRENMVSADEILSPLEQGKDLIIRSDVHGARTWTSQNEPVLRRRSSDRAAPVGASARYSASRRTTTSPELKTYTLRRSKERMPMNTISAASRLCQPTVSANEAASSSAQTMSTPASEPPKTCSRPHVYRIDAVLGSTPPRPKRVNRSGSSENVQPIMSTPNAMRTSPSAVIGCGSNQNRRHRSSARPTTSLGLGPAVGGRTVGAC